ncbi:MAG TPA: helix-turn-helix domain-containing protein [Anaerolineales bacterium]|nr:helix-turn-helix domain-containing protein [Anaerolineales bacterium]
MSVDWLSLSEVAKLLGVHPSTIRSWSDQGVIPTHRTQGGHRRYLRNEIDLWRQSQRSSGDPDVNLVIQNALRTTRIQISEGRLSSEDWYQKLDDEAREQYRLSGRTLLQGLINYLNANGDQAIAEADAIGYEYASRGRRYGLSSMEATCALIFFRNMLMESMLVVYEAAAVRSPHAWSNMFRKINDFTDKILVTILETYEAYQKNSR